MINQTVKPKSRKEKPALKVMHAVDKNADGTFSIGSNAPKLKEAVGMGPKPAKPKDVPSKDVPKAKDEIDNLDYKVLHALDALGGKDVDSMTMAKKVGTTRTNPDAPRAPIRHAMQAFEKMGYVKAEKKGAKYLFSITERGKKAALTTSGTTEGKDVPKDKHDPDDVPDHMLNEAHKAKQAKEAGSIPVSYTHLTLPTICSV